MVNGETGPPVWHCKGLRQGNPLSTMLFVLVIDTLNRLMAKAKEVGLLCRLAPAGLTTTTGIFLYIDDVIIFRHSDRYELLIVRSPLVLFGHTSRLHTNFAKCSVSPIGCSYC